MVGRPFVGRIGGTDAPSIGILSTFPPTECGIATFSAALAAGLVAQGATVDVVRCGDSEDVEDPLVVASTRRGGPRGVRAAVDALNDVDVAIVQHEYGIYGGLDGDDVVGVLRALTSRRSSSPTRSSGTPPPISASCSRRSARWLTPSW